MIEKAYPEVPYVTKEQLIKISNIKWNINKHSVIIDKDTYWSIRVDCTLEGKIHTMALTEPMQVNEDKVIDYMKYEIICKLLGGNNGRT